MLVGTYQRTLDPKLRIVLPTIFRKQLGDAVYLVPFKGALRGYTEKDYLEWIGKLNLKQRVSDDEEMLETISNTTTMVEFDKAGRLSLSKIEDTVPGVCEALGLSGDVVVAGSISYFEIRSKELEAAKRERRSERSVEGLYFAPDQEANA